MYLAQTNKKEWCLNMIYDEGIKKHLPSEDIKMAE